jgi:hypothetical protein
VISTLPPTRRCTTVFWPDRGASGTTPRGETVSGSSCGGEFGSGGGSTKMISDGCPYANRKGVDQAM